MLFYLLKEIVVNMYTFLVKLLGRISSPNFNQSKYFVIPDLQTILRTQLVNTFKIYVHTDFRIPRHKQHILNILIAYERDVGIRSLSHLLSRHTTRSTSYFIRCYSITQLRPSIK
jgi:hypothetical protein